MSNAQDDKRVGAVQRDSNNPHFDIPLVVKPTGGPLWLISKRYV
jgi:hypothetical protein